MAQLRDGVKPEALSQEEIKIAPISFMCPPGTKAPKDKTEVKNLRIKCVASNLVKEHVNPSIPALLIDIAPYRPRGNFANRI